MEKHFKTKAELYAHLIEIIDKRLATEGKNTESINPDDFGISRRQYFYLRKISLGGKAPDLSDTKLKLLEKKLGVKIKASYTLVADKV